MEKEENFISVEREREKKSTTGKGERLFGSVGPSGDYSAMGRHTVLGESNQRYLKFH